MAPRAPLEMSLRVCHACKEEVRPYRDVHPVAFHLAFSVLTGGLWLPFWAFVHLVKRGWRCPHCRARVPRVEGGWWVVRHFEGYRALPPLAFSWRISVEAVGVGLVVAIVAFYFLPFRDLHLRDAPAGLLIGYALLLGPLLETVICQALPIALLRFLRAPFVLQVALSMGLFAAAHFYANGIANGIAAGLVGGFYLAFSYAHWAGISHRTALWVTALSHAMGNVLPVVASLL